METPYIRTAALSFPIDRYSKDSIDRGMFIHGTTSLAAGIAKIFDVRLMGNSVPLVSYNILEGTTGTLRAFVTTNTTSPALLTLQSTSATDTSLISYLVFL